MMLGDNIRMGNNPIARVYHKGKLSYPNPVKDGLILWYDFLGKSNSDPNREIAEDLSENGNNGTLNNFSYELGSGYGSEKEVAERNLYRYSGYPYNDLYPYSPNKVIIDGGAMPRIY